PARRAWSPARAPVGKETAWLAISRRRGISANAVPVVAISSAPGGPWRCRTPERDDNRPHSRHIGNSRNTRNNPPRGWTRQLQRPPKRQGTGLRAHRARGVSRRASTAVTTLTWQRGSTARRKGGESL